ncbi:TetR/AcrR family transcriptional regulator [Aeromonas veronii]
MNISPRSQQKRAAILDAAGRLFCQHGLHLVSMDMVASEAGVSADGLQPFCQQGVAVCRSGGQQVRQQ